jgi:hypothetical protein
MIQVPVTSEVIVEDAVVDVEMEWKILACNSNINHKCSIIIYIYKRGTAVFIFLSDVVYKIYFDHVVWIIDFIIEWISTKDTTDCWWISTLLHKYFCLFILLRTNYIVVCLLITIYSSQTSHFAIQHNYAGYVLYVSFFLFFEDHRLLGVLWIV